MKKNPPLPNSSKKSSKIPPPKMPSIFKPIKIQQENVNSEQIISPKTKTQQVSNQLQNDKQQELMTPITKLLDEQIQASKEQISLQNKQTDKIKVEFEKIQSQRQRQITQYKTKSDQIQNEQFNIISKRAPIPSVNKQKRPTNSNSSRTKSNLPPKPKLKKEQFSSQIKTNQTQYQQKTQKQVLKNTINIQSQNQITTLNFQSRVQQKVLAKQSGKILFQNQRTDTSIFKKNYITQTPQKIKNNNFLEEDFVLNQEKEKDQSSYSQLQQKLKKLSEVRSKLEEDSSEQQQDQLMEQEQQSNPDQIQEYQKQQKQIQIQKKKVQGFQKLLNQKSQQNHKELQQIQISEKKYQDTIYDSNIAVQQNQAEYLPDQFLDTLAKNVKPQQVVCQQNNKQINKVPHIRHSLSLSNFNLIQQQRSNSSNKHNTIAEAQDKVILKNQLNHFLQKEKTGKFINKQNASLDNDKSINSDKGSCEEQEDQEKQANQNHEIYLKQKEKVLAERTNLTFSISAQNAIYHLLKQFRQKKTAYISQVQSQRKINEQYEKQYRQRQQSISIIMNELSHKNKLILNQIQSKGLSTEMKSTFQIQEIK